MGKGKGKQIQEETPWNIGKKKRETYNWLKIKRNWYTLMNII